MPPRNRTLAFALAKLVLIGAALYWLYSGAQVFANFLSDDGFISLRYSRNLVEGKGLVYNASERVEGYSNLLWVLSVAFAGLFSRTDWVLAQHIAGWASYGLLLLAFWLRRDRTFASAWSSMLWVGLSAPVAIWIFGGLEAVQLAACVLLVLVGLERVDDARPWRWLVGVSAALVVWSRPDGILLLLPACVWLFLKGPRWLPGLKRAFALGGLALVAWGAQETFRVLYYGDVLPNTAYVKVAFSSKRVVEGANYVWEVIASAWPFFVLVVVGAVLAVRRKENWLLLCLGTALTWLGWVIFIGGDHLFGYRHVVPALAAFGFVLGEVFRFPERPLLGLGLALVLSLGAWHMQHTQMSAPLTAPAPHDSFARKGREMGELLRKGWRREKPLLATNTAGAPPFYAGFETIDMLGLTDRHIAHHRPDDMGENNYKVGHELGDGRYVLSRKPDIIHMCSLAGSEMGCFRGDKEIYADPQFRRGYHFVKLKDRRRRGGEYRVYVRKDSSKVGIKRSDTEVRVPAYLWANRDDGVTHEFGSFGIVLAQDEMRRQSITLAKGTWRLNTVHTRSLEVTVMGKVVESGATFTIDKARLVPIELRSTESFAHVRWVVFERVDDVPTKPAQPLAPSVEDDG